MKHSDDFVDKYVELTNTNISIDIFNNYFYYLLIIIPDSSLMMQSFND